MSWLVAASLFFYAWWNPSYLILIVFSILFNFSIGVILAQNKANVHLKKILIFGVTANLALLAYFKYANFFVENFVNFTGFEFYLSPIMLPLAISFFTFQQVAYLVDAYRGETREYNFLHYCLFVTFFPQLIAGPIVHHKEMLPQFAKDTIYKLKINNIAIGLTIFSIGLFKKVMIADNFALYATPVFNAAEQQDAINFFMAWQGALAYTFQLYFDFSGYSDMAIGIARLFGIRLPINFNSPYKAYNIIDFWRRWHMTLSRFLRDYLYIPLGGNRLGKKRRYINLMLTMLLGGLWHGAGWSFIIWGGLHGSYLIINTLWRGIWPEEKKNSIYKFLSRLLTFTAVVIAWVFFRAESFDGAIYVLSSMMNLPSAFNVMPVFIKSTMETVGFGFSGGYLTYEYLYGTAWFLAFIIIIWFWPNTQQLLENYRPCYESIKELRKNDDTYTFPIQWRPSVLWGVVIAAILISSLLSLSKLSEFLYFQF